MYKCSVDAVIDLCANSLALADCCSAIPDKTENMRQHINDVYASVKGAKIHIEAEGEPIDGHCYI